MCFLTWSFIYQLHTFNIIQFIKFQNGFPSFGSHTLHAPGYANGVEANYSPVQTYLQTDIREESSVRPTSVTSVPSAVTGEMNVTNPKYDAKYGNHFLRDPSPMFDPAFSHHLH